MGYDRRLPVYLLLDCSESMAGEPIEAVRHGMQAMISDLRGNPMALETAALSIITFANTAQQVVPLTDLLKFQVPSLKMGSGTALGAALSLWQQCLAREVVKSTEGRKGDYKPICFVLSDGAPTDSWESAADQVRKTIAGKQANVIAVGCGPDADVAKLRRITDTVISLKETGPGAFAGFFKWISASVSTASQKLETAGEKGVSLPGLPPELQVPTAAESGTPPDQDRFVYLHARCVKNRKFYIMRYGKAGEEKKGWFGGSTPTYKAVASHPVDDFDLGEGAAGLKVSTNALQDSLPCPHCGNDIWGMCECGGVHCCPQISGTVTLTCPWCTKSDTYGMGSFDVGRGRG